MIANKKSQAKTQAGKKVSQDKAGAGKSRANHDATAVTIDRRASQGRRSADRRTQDAPVAVERRSLERRAKVSRRRQIDPTTCERDYTTEEIEFMGAMDHYKRRSGRMFPTCSEVLEVIKSLGYAKQPEASAIVVPVLDVADSATADLTAV